MSDTSVRGGAPSSFRRGLRHAVIAAVLVFAASLIGGLATGPNIPTWYAGIVKPWFNPPNWVFGPVWTVLYTMLAYALWRVLQGRSPERGRASALFVVQISINALWSVVFFGFRSPDAAQVVVVLLWLSIVLNMWVFLRIDRIAGWIFAPYLAWVSFAAILNFAIAWLN